jgi:NADP-dependent 3-hydroxy acid dehydrogenase YdfG
VVEAEPMKQAAILQGRTAIVTGASSGIGKATALAFLAAGARVVANGRSSSALEGLADLAGVDERSLVSVPGDIAAPETCDALLSAALRLAPSGVDLAVLSAGVGSPGTILTSDPATWQQLFETNILASMRQLRQLAEFMIAQAPPDTPRDLMVVGSSAGRTVSPSNSVYGATKFALHSVVESLRRELAGHSIRVSLIEPGFVRTEFQSRSGYDPQWVAKVEADNGPLLRAEDVADAILYVVSRPPMVHVSDMLLRPTRQASP